MSAIQYPLDGKSDVVCRPISVVSLGEFVSACECLSPGDERLILIDECVKFSGKFVCMPSMELEMTGPDGTAYAGPIFSLS
jgi:hypothetical protein